MTKAVKTTFNLGDVLLISDEGIFTSFVAVVSEISISRNGVSYKMSAGVDNDFWCILDFEYNGEFANQYRVIRKVGEADEFGIKSPNEL